MLNPYVAIKLTKCSCFFDNFMKNLDMSYAESVLIWNWLTSKSSELTAFILLTTKVGQLWIKSIIMRICLQSKWFAFLITLMRLVIHLNERNILNEYIVQLFGRVCNKQLPIFFALFSPFFLFFVLIDLFFSFFPFLLIPLLFYINQEAESGTLLWNSGQVTTASVTGSFHCLDWMARQCL